MSDTNIEFFTFAEAVALAQKEPDTEFVGLFFPAPFKNLGVYSIATYADQPGEVSIQYDGGALFSSCGEEGFYDLEDVPAEAKELFYARKAVLGSGDVEIAGMTSEYVLQDVLPGLGSEDDYRDRAHFVQAAGEAFARFWRQR